MAQVTYFKLTKPYAPDKPMSAAAVVWTKLTRRLPGEGKRLLRMAPLHHHFEAISVEKGQPEWKTVANFWMVQLLLCVATFWLFTRAFSPGP
jgi:UDP-N-acetylmuramyl pentapeptide phosphotransferase/UDP-N-acetylglucosamine-1-phosphate transferase